MNMIHTLQKENKTNNRDKVYCLKKERRSEKRYRNDLKKWVDVKRWVYIGWIIAKDCNRCEYYNPSKDSSIVCNRLYGKNVWNDLIYASLYRQNNIGGYEFYYPLQKEFAKMKSTKEVMKFLIKEYNLEIDHSLIFKYAEKGLITKEQKIGHGKSKGVQTFWEDSAPYKVYYIKQLLKKFKFILEEISKYKNLIYNFDEELNKIYSVSKEDNIEFIRKLERAKLETVIITYACAEAGYKYGLTIIPINNKIFMPILYAKIEKNRIIEIHVKILDTKELQNDKTLKDKKAYKEIIFKKEGIKIIG